MIIINESKLLNEGKIRNFKSDEYDRYGAEDFDGNKCKMCEMKTGTGSMIYFTLMYLYGEETLYLGVDVDSEYDEGGLTYVYPDDLEYEDGLLELKSIISKVEGAEDSEEASHTLLANGFEETGEY